VTYRTCISSQSIYYNDSNNNDTNSRFVIKNENKTRGFTKGCHYIDKTRAHRYTVCKAYGGNNEAFTCRTCRKKVTRPRRDKVDESTVTAATSPQLSQNSTTRTGNGQLCCPDCHLRRNDLWPGWTRQEGRCSNRVTAGRNICRNSSTRMAKCLVK